MYVQRKDEVTQLALIKYDFKKSYDYQNIKDFYVVSLEKYEMVEQSLGVQNMFYQNYFKNKVK